MKIYSNLMPGVEIEDFKAPYIKLGFESEDDAYYFDGMVMGFDDYHEWVGARYVVKYNLDVYYQVLSVLEEYERNGAEIIKED